MKLKTPCRIPSVRSFLLAVASFSALALQAASTSYINSSGVSDTADCTAITSSTTTLETGWYVVEGTVTISSTVTVNGNVNLILADGAKLTVSVSESYKAGILVANDGTTVNKLTIWCQSCGTGELVASGGFFAAGIGGDYTTTDCGAVTIYGGSITATGNYGAGIGGGTGGAGGDVAINGGTVVARDGSSGDAAGIGRGAYSSKSQGTLTVSDKIEVLAGSSESTASLLTRNSDTGAVTISGQKWFFAGPQSLHQGTTSFTAYSGAVGSAINIDLADTIMGGTGVYTFGLKDGSSLPEWLTLSGATLSGTPVEEGSSTFTFVVEDTSEPTLSLEATYTVVVKDRYSITYKDGESTLLLDPTTYIKGTGVATLPMPTKASHEFQGWFTNALFAGTQFTSISTTDSGDFTFYSKWLQLTTGDVSVTFVGEGSVPLTKTCTIVESSMTTLSDTGSTEGWYVVYNNVSFSSSVTISGNVKLVLMDGKTMTAKEDSDTSHAGVVVTGSNSLTVYGQSQNSGTLNATGGSISAGIGGGWNQAGGTVTINGGTIIATAISGGAGIGGGYQMAGGAVTINGGVVTAVGQGAGIGGGSGSTPGAGGTVTINGGTVTATGGYSGAGIGGGSSTAAQGTLTVSSAVTVKAGSSANPTTELSHGAGGAIDLSTFYRYYTFETTGPTPLSQTQNAFSAYAGETKNWNLADTITGGTTPYTLTPVTGFEPPSGLSLSGTALSGSVAVADTYTIKYTVTDSSDTPLVLEAVYTLTVTTPDPITAATGLSATVGKAKAFNIAETISGGVPPYSLSFSGTEPTGFSYNAGVLSGTATEANTYNFAITVSDSIGTEQILNYTLVTAESAGFIDDDPEEPASGDSVDCRTADGVVRSRTCNLLTSSSTVWENSWYYVAPNTTLSIAGVTVNGKVSLVLGDGATLTVKSSTSGKAGVCVVVDGAVTNSLTIYCQRAGTGKLIATGNGGGAGIGGNNETSSHTDLGDCGKVTIYGGVIEATGGTSGGAGIGGGDYGGAGGKVTIYDGLITAVADSSYASGIGGGYQSVGGDVAIYGGSVIASSKTSSYAGIGGPSDKNQGTLTVGERVIVKAGSSSALTDADIQNPNGETAISLSTIKQYYATETSGPAPLAQTQNSFAVYKDEAVELSFADTVSGGTKPYTFEYKSGSLPAGISSATLSGTPTEAGTFVFVVAVTDSGVDAEAQVEDFTYTLTVTAKPKTITYFNGADEITGLTPSNYVEGVGATLPTTAPAASGYELEGWYLTSACDGDKVTAISAEATGDQVFYANWKATVYNVVYMKDSTTQFDDPAPTTYTVESAALVLPTTAVNGTKSFEGWYVNAGCTGDAITEIPHGSTGDWTLYAKWGAAKSNETYVDASGNTMPAVECSSIESDSTELATGWYVVKGNVTIPTHVAVSGNAKLILADGATLTIQSDNSYKAGINIPSYASLAVYAQTVDGTGSLVVTGGGLASGIGGEWNESPGAITINGGTVTATATSGGAGIGGGQNGAGGTIVINNGTVTAIGGTFGAGIGGGYQCDGGTVTINGGTVTAYSSGYGAGIGKGYTGSSEGSLAVGANMVVESGDDVGSLAELGTGGAITLDGLRYYVVRKAGVAPLAQTASAFAAYVGEVFELNLGNTVSGGSGSYLFTLKDSTLPAWLTRTGDVLSGTPTAEGVCSFTYTVEDTVETTLDAEDFTYIVSVEIRPQPITYMDGAEEMKGLTPSNYIEGVGVELPLTASKTGYLHLGWYTAASGGERVYSVSAEATGPLTFYAHWTTESYTITYKDGNTTLTGLAPTYYDIETATFNLPEPLAPEGKAFVGWFTDPDFNTQATSIPAGSTGHKTFYVKWRDAEAGEGEMLVSFINGDGTPREEMCKVMTSAMTTLETGWYVVANSLEFTQYLTINGNVNIVLMDGKTLSVNATTSSFSMKPGILVASGNSLTIYAQEVGSGALEAIGDTYGAGIGSGYGQNAGTVTINGGVVTATGNEAAGIGGGSAGTGGDIVINRGSVTASSINSGAGIGGGGNSNGNCGTVTINGGEVVATGADGAGIGGGGSNGAGGVITITGGTVVATGNGSAAGIGGSDRGDGATVTITGGHVTATACAAYRYGIGGGNRASSNGSLTIGAGMKARAGDGMNPSNELTVDSSGVVTLVAKRYYVVADADAPIGPTLYEIQYFDGQYNQIQVEPSTYEAGTVTVLGTPAEKPGYVFVGWYTLPNFNSEKVTQIGANETGVKMFYAKWEKASERAVVNYLDVDGVEKSVECTIISGEKDLLTNGWYAVTNNVTLTHGLGVTNDVRLVIADNVTLTVSNGTFGKAGIHVPSDSFLTIFGQSGDSGVLSVTGGSYAAGIGGDRDEASSGAVTVNGGVVIAQGGSKGAGIGGGGSGSGGAVTINGGTVTASGGNDAAGIGGGYTGSCGAVTINGGTVTANGGASSYDSGAGIGGGGYGGSGGDVVINGGTVTATSGGRYSDGIGSGNGEGTRGTLKAGEGVNVWAGANADSAEELTQKKEDGTFWIFGTYNYYHAETATAESEFNIYYYDSDGETPLDLSPAKYQSGTGLAVLPTPAARAGYTFAGWWTSQWAHLAEPVTEIAPGSTGNVTIYAKWTPNTYTITYVTDPMVIEDLGPVSYTYGVGVAELPEPESSNPYMIFDGWYEDSVKVTSISATAVGDKTLTARWIEDATKVTSVTFVGAEGSQTESCRVLTTDVTALETGWYVVNADLEYEAQGLAVSGDVKLVLADGASLTATAASYSQKAGINVPEGASLTIYAQSEGTGELTVAGDPENLGYAAGIGGNMNESCGTVTIYGGVVTASSNDGGAGIGGGYKGHGGTVVINGGTVTATSGGYGAGIGGGKGTINNGGHGGSVTINGGTVVATADYMAAGIGGGYYGDGGTVTINGGVVTATGGPAESGIGKGAGAETQVVLTVGDGISVFVGDSENPSIDMLETDEYGVVTMPSRPKQYYIVRADSGEPAFEIVDGVLVGANIKGNADIVIPDGVLEIGQRVFEDETALRSVVIPNSVTNIGYSAFDGCTSLTNVTFGTGVKSIVSYAFTGCSALTEVEIPGNVKDIGEGAFYGCSSLVTLTLGEGVETLGEYAFSGCTSLTHGADGLYFPDSITTIGNWVLANCPGVTKVSLPGSLYTVGSPLDAVFGWSIAVTYRTDAPVFHFSASNEGQLVRVDPNGNTSITLPAEVKEVFWTSFTNCPAVTHVTVPGTVTNILTRAFANFGSLRTVTIQEGVETIESQAFYGCSNLTEVTIPNSVTNLGDSVFGGCASLGSATIGNGVTEILQFMFYPCTSLTNVTLGASVERIAYNAFWNCAALKDINLPASLTLIENSAFWGCSSLESVRIPEHATVQYFAFHSCTGLESVYIGKGATLQNNVFVGCTGIKSVNVAASEATPLRRKLKMMSASAKGMPLLGALSNPDATTLGDYAFYGCSDLESVALGSTVEDIGGGVFAGCPKLTTVTVEDGNDSYMAVDGMLLTKDGSTLVCAFGSETSVSVTSSVTRVSSGAFAGYATLTNVTLQSGVVTIGEAAFSNATAFATITIPSSVTAIGANAFCDTALATVYVAKGDKARVKALVEGAGYLEAATYVELGDEPTDWPETPSSVAGQTASEAFGVTGELANAKADDLATWAKAKGVDFSDKDDIIPDAFLLNCANTAAAVEEATEDAEEAIAITEITIDENGVPQLTYPAEYGNGQVVVQGSATLGGQDSWHDGKQPGDFFFRTVLRLK